MKMYLHEKTFYKRNISDGKANGNSREQTKQIFSIYFL